MEANKGSESWRPNNSHLFVILSIYPMKGSSYPNKYSQFSVPLLLLLFLVWVPFLLGIVHEDDVRCLRDMKHSLTDPQGKLSSWNFMNSSGTYICSFAGVICWNYPGDRLLGLQLTGFGLLGSVPESLKYCSSLQNLDLSGNQLSGLIPDICSWMPFLVSVDLSNNFFSGSIPPDFANCSYLNKLSLANNRLSGSIPYQLSRLQRLKELSVADNNLEGSVPYTLKDFGKDAFRGNTGLCGQPLGKCGGLSEKSLTIIIAAAGFSLMFGLGLWWR